MTVKFRGSTFDDMGQMSEFCLYDRAGSLQKTAFESGQQIYAGVLSWQTSCGEGRSMACISCGAINQGRFLSDVDIHLPGLRNVEKSPVLVYPELLVCLNRGKAEFTVPKEELVLFAASDASDTNDAR